MTVIDAVNDKGKLMHEMIDRLYLENNLSKEELAWLIDNIDEEHKELLFDYAVKTRRRYYGDKVYMRGLIEFSNICKQNCLLRT